MQRRNRLRVAVFDTLDGKGLAIEPSGSHVLCGISKMNSPTVLHFYLKESQSLISQKCPQTHLKLRHPQEVPPQGTPAPHIGVSRSLGILGSKDTLSNLSESHRTEDEGRTTSPDWPISIETPEPAGWRGTGWKDVMSNSSSLLANVDWDRTFWKPTNANETMHTLGIKGEDGA